MPRSFAAFGGFAGRHLRFSLQDVCGDIYGDDVVSVRKLCMLTNLQGGRVLESEAHAAARLFVARLLP